MISADTIPSLLIYEDDDLIVINKPYGYFVHKSSLDATSDQILMYPVRDYANCRVYPVHRLDRKTSGVLIFTKNRDALVAMNRLFEQRNTQKTYLSICRGFMPADGVIDYPLVNDAGKVQEAITRFSVVQQAEIDLPSHKFPTSRYSLVEFYPETGRMHQIRKHAAHIFHPIIADRPHGCNKQNRMLLEKLDIQCMTLHACSLELNTQEAHKKWQFFAPLPDLFIATAQKLGFKIPEKYSDVTLFYEAKQPLLCDLR